MNPRAMAPFDEGPRPVVELLTHANSIMNPAQDCAIRNLHKYFQSVNGIEEGLLTWRGI